MDEKKKSPTRRRSHSKRNEDSNSFRIVSQVRKLFLSGNKFTASEINEIVGFNDARKVISVLRSEGWQISDTRLSDNRKLYWLVSPVKQYSFFEGKEGDNV